MNIWQNMRQSAKELKNIRTLTMAALLIAMSVVLNSVRVQISADLRISFGFLATAMTGMLFGPFVGMISGALTDIVSFVIAPTGAYFPGFTISAIVGGFFYGVFLYRKEIKFYRALLAKACVSVFVNMFLNTLWLSLTQGKGMLLLLPERVIKNLLLLPLESVLLYFVAVVVFKVAKQAKITG